MKTYAIMAGNSKIEMGYSVISICNDLKEAHSKWELLIHRMGVRVIDLRCEVWENNKLIDVWESPGTRSGNIHSVSCMTSDHSDTPSFIDNLSWPGYSATIVISMFAGWMMHAILY